MTNQNQFMNVKENWTLADTIVISARAAGNSFGWFLNYAALGLATVLNFFNVRNRTAGLWANNQDTRDTFPYAYLLESIGVRFWAPSMQAWVSAPQGASKTDDVSHHIFVTDLPRHCFTVLKIQQDEKLKINTAMIPSGHGVQGDGYAQYAGGGHWDSINQGVVHCDRRWDFCEPIEIPRRANLSVEINLSEYARDLLTNLNNGNQGPFVNLAGDGQAYASSVSGIQVTLMGKRLVQQRGELHA